jgi:uncharacterized protein YwbE
MTNIVRGGLLARGLSLGLVLASGLTGCSSWRGVDSDMLHASASHPRGVKLALLTTTRIPVLVVKSPEGMGRAELTVSQPMPEGLVVEFPGLKQLEHVALKHGADVFACEGSSAEITACTWGRDWPVGSLRRYPTGMTLTVPPAVLARPGDWSLEWVDYWRN